MYDHNFKPNGVMVDPLTLLLLIEHLFQAHPCYNVPGSVMDRIPLFIDPEAQVGTVEYQALGQPPIPAYKITDRKNTKVEPIMVIFEKESPLVIR